MEGIVLWDNEIWSRISRIHLKIWANEADWETEKKKSCKGITKDWEQTSAKISYRIIETMYIH